MPIYYSLKVIPSKVARLLGPGPAACRYMETATLYGAQIGAPIPLEPVTLRYCLYARKSSEAEEKQALSVDSQINEMLALAKRDGLNVIDMYR